LEQALILVDSNVWIDIIQRDPVWLDWSLAHLDMAAQTDELAINAIIFAELAPNFETSVQLMQFVKASKAKAVPLSYDCVYLAGCTHLKYRQSKRTRRTSVVGVLADFFIGAQAQAEGMTILTRDSARYKTYFPKVTLICPR
jgi:predicted nucleic acid-binding protein